MAKTSFTSLKLKQKEEKKSITYNDIAIEINQYLSEKSKYDIVMITLQKAFENGIYNPVLLDMYFHLHLVYTYAEISFTEKQKEDEFKLYDILKSNGLMDEIISNIPEQEYDSLLSYLEEYVNKKEKYNKSVVSLINEIITDLPNQAQAAADIINNFDKEKFQEVMDFVKNANGGRNI